jgi:ribosomal protein L35
MVCVLAALTPLAVSEPRPATLNVKFPGWPTTFEGQVLVALPLSEDEKRFEREYPGKFGRFSDGRREIMIRWIAQRTRKLHPSAECYKARGYDVQDQPVHLDSAGVRWGCYTATKGAYKVRIRERIYDGTGQSWTDVSAWYWSALGGKTQGPWWAVSAGELMPDIRL